MLTTTTPTFQSLATDDLDIAVDNLGVTVCVLPQKDSGEGISSKSFTANSKNRV